MTRCAKKCTAYERCSLFILQLLQYGSASCLSNQLSLTTHRPYFHMKSFVFVSLAGELLTRARPVCSAPFSQVVAMSFSCLLATFFHVDRYCHSWVVCSATELPNFLCVQFLILRSYLVVFLFIGVFFILHVSCAFRFYHRPVIVVLAKDFLTCQ